MNLVVTNVAGPPVPLYLAGARLLELFPMMPVIGNLTLVVAVLSYAGQLKPAAVADHDRGPDVEMFAEGVRSALGNLARSVSCCLLRCWDGCAHPSAPPAGWNTHPLAGSEEAFFPSGFGITVKAGWTSAVIRHPAEMALTPSLRLRWSWRADTLPSRLPEDTALTHDYLSVALEFDDGQDLTWHWSCCLPEGFSYRCPLPHWRRRGTHIVAHTGTADLSRWIDEERPVLATGPLQRPDGDRLPGRRRPRQ